MNIVSVPNWIRRFYRPAIWKIPISEKVVYLTFDDGPTPMITERVMDLLDEYNAKATFFCIGAQVEKHLNLFKEIQNRGHRIGNHTFNHISGWRSTPKDYLDDIERASQVIPSSLFRPPYGRITKKQFNKLKEHYTVVFWDIIPGDFILGITKEKLLKNTLKHLKSGSVIVFHDSVKCGDVLLETLPVLLEELKQRGYRSEVIPFEY